MPRPEPYISSSCFRGERIGDVVADMAEQGFRKIELSGGTQPYPQLTEDLLQLQEQYQLDLLCHNYFPPPPIPFVLNLASLDDAIYAASLSHVEGALNLSRQL